MIETVPQNDISTIWGDVWLRTVGNWDDVPQQKKLDLIHECWQVYDVQDNIYKGRANLDDYRYLLDTPAERFMDHVAIPLITVGSMFTPATAPVAFSSSARTAAVVVPKLKQIATALGAAEVLEETMTFFSKKAGGDNPRPRAERVIPTQADQLRFSQQQRASGAWKNCESGRWQGSFESRKGDYRFTPTVEKWEFEVYKKVAKGWQHCGVMRAVGPEKGEILDRFAKGIIKK